MAFIFIGQVNILAPIVTINFMLTYSFIDYSYFSVAMSLQLQGKEKDNPILAKRNQRMSTRQSSRPLIETALPNYGSGGESSQSKGTLLEFTKDMDQIFPPVSNVDAGAEETSSVQELSSRHKSQRATAKQKLMDSFGLDLNSNMFSEQKGEEIGSASPHEEADDQCGSAELEPKVKSQTNACHVEQVLSADAHSHNTGDTLYPWNPKLDRRWANWI